MTADPEAVARALHQRIADVDRRWHDGATFTLTAAEIAEARDVINALRRDVPLFRERAERAEHRAHEVDRRNGALMVESDRVKRDAAFRVAAAEAFAVEAGFGDAEVAARVAAEHAHYANIERCHAAEVKHLQASISRLQRELKR